MVWFGVSFGFICVFLGLGWYRGIEGWRGICTLLGIGRCFGGF